MPADPNEERRLRAGGGEEALIADFWAPLAAGYARAYGLKDDCATIAVAPGEELVVTTDALIEGVHFFAGDDPGAIAWKALAVNVSDLIAKGANPVAYVMNVALPAFDRGWLHGFADGLGQAQQAFGCQLAGGDTDRTPGPLTVAITAFGTCPAGQMVRRSTARAGDCIYVTGTIGDAALGLRLRRDPGLAARCGLDAEAVRYLEGRFSRPHPSVAIVPALRAAASAAIDVSDGLMKDIDRLCRVAGGGGRIDAAAVPLSAPARVVVAAGETRLEELFAGGEDYEVLATVPPAASVEFERLAEVAGVPVACIGAVTDEGNGATAIGSDGAALALSKLGWDHFSQP